MNLCIFLKSVSMDTLTVLWQCWVCGQCVCLFFDFRLVKKHLSGWYQSSAFSGDFRRIESTYVCLKWQEGLQATEREWESSWEKERVCSILPLIRVSALQIQRTIIPVSINTHTHILMWTHKHRIVKVYEWKKIRGTWEKCIWVLNFKLRILTLIPEFLFLFLLFPQNSKKQL